MVGIVFNAVYQRVGEPRVRLGVVFRSVVLEGFWQGWV